MIQFSLMVKWQGPTNLFFAIDFVERELICQAMTQCAGNKTRAAELLSINRTTLIEKIKRLNLSFDKERYNPNTVRVSETELDPT